jgi:hypothetical protein
LRADRPRAWRLPAFAGGPDQRRATKSATAGSTVVVALWSKYHEVVGRDVPKGLLFLQSALSVIRLPQDGTIDVRRPGHVCSAEDPIYRSNIRCR